MMRVSLNSWCLAGVRAGYDARYKIRARRSDTWSI
jgi:hypothetical protein